MLAQVSRPAQVNGPEKKVHGERFEPFLTEPEKIYAMADCRRC